MFRGKIQKLFISFCFLIISNLQICFSQVSKQNSQTISRYHEEIDDPYIPVNKSQQSTSPAFNFSSPRIITHQVNVNNKGLNILGDAANEPSLAIDPTNPKRIFIAWRQFDSNTNNFRQAGYGYSLDGGNTWKVPGPLEPGIFRSDPVLDSDADGNIYFNSLEEDFQCHVFKATPNNTWTQKTFAFGGDKQWMAIDKQKRFGNSHAGFYAGWSFNYTVCNPGSFTRSVNGGLSYDSCLSLPDESRFGNLAIGPYGELYHFGEYGGFFVSKSTNAGNLNKQINWDFSKEVDLDGFLNLYVSPNPQGLLGQPWIATDISAGANKGNVYVLCSVERNSKIDHADVMFARSIDGGNHWQKPIQINDDSLDNNWNWFGTMSVAPNGRIDVIWLDTRNDPGGLNSQLYYSKSLDGGLSWSKNEALSIAFDPKLGYPNQSKIGDYYHMISANQGAHLAWAATFNGEQDVYYSFIPADVSTKVDNLLNESSSAILFQNYPNPFNDETQIQYTIKKSCNLKLEILDVNLSRSIKILTQENAVPGTYSIIWDGKNINGNPVPDGVYFYRLLISDGSSYYQKLILLR